MNLENQKTVSKQGVHSNLVSSWVIRKGVNGLYNLNGIIRAHPIKVEDLPNLGFFSSLVHLRGRAEELGVIFLSGEPEHHDGLVTDETDFSAVTYPDRNSANLWNSFA